MPTREQWVPKDTMACLKEGSTHLPTDEEGPLPPSGATMACAELVAGGEEDEDASKRPTTLIEEARRLVKQLGH